MIATIQRKLQGNYLVLPILSTLFIKETTLHMHEHVPLVKPLVFISNFNLTNKKFGEVKKKTTKLDSDYPPTIYTDILETWKATPRIIIKISYTKIQTNTTYSTEQ